MREITLSQALNEALREEMRRDETIFVAGEDVARFGGIFGVTAGLLSEFGHKRVKDTPITESAIAGIALGSALTGLRPVVEIQFMDFLCSCMDEVVNQIAKIRYMYGGAVKAPLVIRTQGGGGFSAAAQHSQSLEAWFVHLPGVRVVMPGTPYDAKGLLKSAIRDDDPVLFVEHKALYQGKGPVPEGEFTIPLGKAEVKRHGKDVTVVAYSLMLGRALSTAEKLAQEGIKLEVIDPRTLSPLDGDAVVESVRKTRKLIIMHEAPLTGGFGAELSALVTERAFDALDAPPKRLACPDVPLPFAPVMEKFCIPDEEDLIKAVRELVGERAAEA
ncbi:MAG: alpha-ketoacid dehydrogenase subunit beta [Nitrospinota bacterium]